MSLIGPIGLKVAKVSEAEVRPGTSVFTGSNYLAAEAHSLGDCALSVHTLVVSPAVAGQTVIDVGSKTFSSDASQIPAGSKKPNSFV